MQTNELLEKYRVIFYHKQPISALTQFAQYSTGSVIAPAPLPKLATALDEGTPIPEGDSVTALPSSIVQQIAEPLRFPADVIRVEPDYHALIEVPTGTVTVYMAKIDTIDPPYDLAELLGFTLRPLTALRGRPPAEMELLRRAYVHLMEG